MTIIVDRSFAVVKRRDPANPTSMMNYGLVDGVNSSFAMIDPDNFDDVHEVVVHSLAFLSESLSGPHSYTASTETTLVNPDPVIGFYQTATLIEEWIYTYDNPSLNHTDTEYEYYELLGGIVNARLFVYNNSDYFVDKIVVKTEYVRQNGSIYKTHKFVINGMYPNSKETCVLPSSEWGKRLNEYKTYVYCSALDIEIK